MWFFYYFYFERNYNVLKSKCPCILLNKNIKTKRNRKRKIPHTVLEKRTMCFISYKNRKERRRHFLYRLFCPKRIYLNVLPQCLVYWIHFQNIHTFAYRKTLIHTLLLLVFKIVESLQCILKDIINPYSYLLKSDNFSIKTTND